MTMRIYHDIDSDDPTDYLLTPRPEVMEFAVAMEEKLRKKDGKTHWRERPIEALTRLMLLEVEEFKVAHEFFGADESMDELRDIANYAMILWDRIRIEKVRHEQSVPS